MDEGAFYFGDDLVVDVAHWHSVAGGGEELADVAFHGGGEGFGGAVGRGGVGRAGVGEFGADDFVVDGFLGVEGGEAAHEVFEFADVAGPAMLAEAVERGAVQGFGSHAGFAGFFEEVAGEDGDVFEALAQGGEADGDDVEAVEEVFAELAGADGLAEVAVGGGDDADVGADGGAAADGGELAFLEDAEEPGLGFGGHVADLVEEEGAAGGLFEAALGAVHGASEGAAFVAEEFAFDELAGDCGHVDGDEGAGAAAAVVVEGAGDEFLAGAAFAVDHDGEVGGGEAGDGAVDLLHCDAATDEGEAFFGVTGLGRGGVGGWGGLSEGAADDGEKFF